MSENPYEVLGLAPGATPEDIKAAYRALALRFHPDHNPGDRAAEQAFKRVDQAYTFLSDPAKKAQYDRIHVESAEEPASEPPRVEPEPAAPPWEPNSEPHVEVPPSDTRRLARRAADLLLILAGIAVIATWRATTDRPGDEFVAAAFEPRYQHRHTDAKLILTAGFALAGYGALRFFVDDAP